MVNRFEQARRNLSRYRQDIQGRLNQLRQQRSALEQQRQQVESIKRQLSSQEAVRGVGGLSSLLERNQQISRVEDVRQQIQSSIDQLNRLEASQFNPALSQISEASMQVKLAEKAIGRKTQAIGELRSQARADILAQFESQGLVPIIDKGKIIGFEGQTFTPASQEELAQFDVPGLPQPGALGPIRPFSPAPPVMTEISTQDIERLRAEREGLQLGIEPPSELPITSLVTQREIGFVSLPGSPISQRATMEQVPQGVQRNIIFTSEPQQVIPRTVSKAQGFQFVDPNAPLNIQVLQALGRGTEFVVQKFRGKQDVLGQDSVFFKPTGIPPEFVGGLIAGGLFGPAFASGAVAQQVEREDFVTIARRFLRDLFERRKLGGEVGKQAESGIKNTLKQLIDQADESQINSLRQFVKREFGKTGERLFDEVLSERMVFIPVEKGTIDVPSTITGAGGTTGVSSLPGIVQPFEGKAEGAIRGAETEFEKQTGFIRPKDILDSPQSPFFEQPTTRIRPLEGQVGLPRMNIIEDIKESLTQTQPQATRQGQLPGQQQPQRPGQSQLPGLASALGLASAQQEAQQQRFRTPQLQIPRQGQPSRQGGGQRQPLRPTRPGGPPPVLPTSAGTTLNRGLAKLKRQAKAFDVEVMRKGKWTKVADDLPFYRAIKKGTEVSLGTLAAQFRVVPDRKAKPKKKDIARFIPDQNIFRNYQIKKGSLVKLSPGHWIERRNQRITSGGELSEIEEFKKLGKKPGRKKKNPFGI